MQKSFLLSPEGRIRVCRYCTKNLRNLRRSLGLRQSEFADAIGTTQRHISEIENGKAKVSWTLMLAISTVLVRYPFSWQEEYEVISTGEYSDNYSEGRKDWEAMLTDLSTR